MRTTANFAHTDAPEYLRDHIRNWVESAVKDLDPENRLKVDLFCSKESARHNNSDAKFKCVIFAKAPWLGKTITIESMGQSCWGTILDCSRRLRQQVSRKRKMRTHYKHRHCYQEGEMTVPV